MDYLIQRVPSDFKQLRIMVQFYERSYLINSVYLSLGKWQVAWRKTFQVKGQDTGKHQGEAR